MKQPVPTQYCTRNNVWKNIFYLNLFLSKTWKKYYQFRNSDYFLIYNLRVKISIFTSTDCSLQFEIKNIIISLERWLRL